jgi:hypothetical protein
MADTLKQKLENRDVEPPAALEGRLALDAHQPEARRLVEADSRPRCRW